MTGGQLPRLEASFTNKNMAMAILQLVAGSTLAIVSIVMWSVSLLADHFFESSGYPLRVLQWVMIIVAVLLFCLSGQNFSLNNRYKRLQELVSAENELNDLANRVGVSTEKLLSDLSMLNHRGYFKSIEITDNSISIYPKVNQINNTIPGSPNFQILAEDGMFFSHSLQHVEMPKVLVFSALLAVVSLLPVKYKFLLLLIAIALTFILSKILTLFMPRYKLIKYKERQSVPTQKIELMLSNNQQADQLIILMEGQLQELKDLSFKIGNLQLKTDMDKISDGLTQMATVIRENPDKHTLVRETVEYTIPTAIKIYYSYIDLDMQPVKGDNIRAAIDKAHDVSRLVVTTLEKEVDGLYHDRSLDIEVDLEVMRNVLQQEAIDIHAYKKNLELELSSETKSEL